ncbi:hypothetical protein [Shewanella aestuarii]|uniref:Uncharacterized protein n=1 Tax=Shewanella aestuarii TaxID=1028752 RepID=A0A6G9QRJ0_9GAMM|nr:hypothetical protein [Shewanella aestuarii]QIR16647.1 hypothetical protein HBH39_19430 [Shewanella aestuarii]
MSFTTRSGKFDYSGFVKSISINCEIGESISPRCTRETFELGNSDPVDVASKKLRFAFDRILGNSASFKRKRAEAGGYEYLKVN